MRRGISMMLSNVSARSGRAFIIAGLVGLVAALSFASPAEARRKKNRAPGYSPPYAAIVVDAKTGRVLHGQNENALRHPASVTKVMTLYLLFEQLESGRVKLDTPLRVSARASRQAPSKIGFEPGESIEVEDAIKALVTKSANDVASVVAENIGGSEDAFAQSMTRRARSLGMNSTTFKNASGLPDVEQVTTARDLAILARAIQERFPKYYSYFGTRTFNYAGNSYRNHNKLLGRIEGVDGIKTGYTRMSGFNLMTSARTEDRHVVAVVLGGRSGASRDNIMASLVTQQMPRAYAGARTAQPVVTAAATQERPRPAVVAAAPVKTNGEAVAVAVATSTNAAAQRTASVAPEAAQPQRRGEPLHIASAKPVSAAAYASSPATATPSAFKLIAGPQPVKLTAQLEAEQAPSKAEASKTQASKIQDRIEPLSTATIPAKAETKVAKVAPAKVEQAKTEAAKIEATKAETVKTAASDTRRNVATGWMIQLGATDDEAKAREILANAKSRSKGTLSAASGFTEKVVKGGTTLFRARFAGFGEADDAQSACNTLKRSGFACFATRG
jgi:D-alanyl-D-alanine carboxypeptidase